MMETIARLHTEHGEKYIAQLCRHFAHKVDVLHSDNRGECRFVCGTAVMEAHEGAMRIRVTAPDESQLKETQDVVESHLLRFAFREELQPLTWETPTMDNDRGAVPVGI
jgi:uncharacterized protein